MVLKDHKKLYPQSPDIFLFFVRLFCYLNLQATWKSLSKQIIDWFEHIVIFFPNGNDDA
jgi:hypothetical protein